jgi:hypothetical protein
MLDQVAAEPFKTLPDFLVLGYFLQVIVMKLCVQQFLAENALQLFKVD